MSKDVHITDEQVEEMRRTGDPLFVPIEGDGEVVVQDAQAYRRMLRVFQDFDDAETARICQERWEALESGEEAGLTVEEFIDQIRRTIGKAQ